MSGDVGASTARYGVILSNKRAASRVSPFVLGASHDVLHHSDSESRGPPDRHHLPVMLEVSLIGRRGGPGLRAEIRRCPGTVIGLGAPGIRAD